MAVKSVVFNHVDNRYVLSTLVLYNMISNTCSITHTHTSALLTRAVASLAAFLHRVNSALSCS